MEQISYCEGMYVRRLYNMEKVYEVASTTLSQVRIREVGGSTKMTVNKSHIVPLWMQVGDVLVHSALGTANREITVQMLSMDKSGTYDTHCRNAAGKPDVLTEWVLSINREHRNFERVKDAV